MTSHHNDRTDQADQSTRTDQADQSARADLTDRAGQSDLTDLTDQADQSDQADQADQSARADRAGQWDDLGYGPWEEAVLPKHAPAEETRARLDLPRSIRPIDHETVTQQPVFDPALAGYSRAIRPSEPAFTQPEAAQHWLAARREALNTVLSAVAESAWAEHLVLRGSVLLRAWYGEAAREPGDLDFVVRPEDWQLDDPRTDRMLGEIAAAAERLSGRVRLHADQAAADEIWTYSRIPGRRLVVPWSAPGVPGGTVQLDFVFTEHLPAEPQPDRLPGVSGSLLTATPALSLAWKILWLISDNHPQGKDMYDAVLLARSTEVPYELLRQVFTESDESWGRYPVTPDQVAELDVDWDEFAKDYPQLAQSGEEYPARLLALLGPTFAGRTEYALRALWLAPLVEEFQEVLARTGIDGVQQLMAERHLLMANSLVITRELLGCDLAEAHRLVAAHRADAPRRARELRAAVDRFAAELPAEGPGA
ncbi:nucleotidyl transferase AbiEii/AbiGii toxin family protein [Kitasatospora sp. NPDC056138]|uniref:nucleotidyl transferase AbiEii/AbiGii toxin family protein n=1 Tax=Kitasatospora sp. NPDC056138 TaxID=3345724 RepID=UPI0035D9DD8A